MFSRKIRAFVALSFLTATACDQSHDVRPPTSNQQHSTVPGYGDQTDDPEVCLAVRGNGQLITSHFAAIARVLEHFGPMDGASGGSSGSVTLFFLESIQMNPYVTKCGDEECSKDVQGQRAALLFKSMQGYLAELRNAVQGGRGRANGVSESANVELSALLGRFDLADQARGAATRGQQMFSDNRPESGRQLVEALENASGLVNPEIRELVMGQNNLFHVRELIEGLRNFGTFGTDDHKILVRPGIVNFGHQEVAPTTDQDKVEPSLTVPRVLSRVADFYAAYEPVNQARMQAFVQGCAGRGENQGRGDNWKDIAELALTAEALELLPEDDVLKNADTTCGLLFSETVNEFRQAKTPEHKTRLNEEVGEHVRALISTSVMTNKSGPAGLKQHWERARIAFIGGQSFNWAPPTFGDVGFGYWGKPQDVNPVAQNVLGFDDDKSLRAVNLGEATWKFVLTYSPAEPGLARALEINDKWVSAGGWSDLHPTLALRNMGCDKVIYVTRKGGASSFQTGMAKMLGAKDELNKLYATDDDSSLTRSLAAADVRVCTNWDEFFGEQALDIPTISDDGYNAQWETSDDMKGAGWLHAYANATQELKELAEDGTPIEDSQGRKGCSTIPGIGVYGR